MAVPTRNTSGGLFGTLSSIGQKVSDTFSSLTSPKIPVVKPGTTVPTRTATGAQPIATGTVLNTLGAYNPYTGGYEQQAGDVGVNQGQFSVENKQKLWADSGNTGGADLNAFYRKEDGTMGIKPDFVKKVNPGELQDKASADAYLNGIANQDFVDNGGKTTSTDWAALATQMGGALKGTAPENFNRADAYQSLRDQYGIANLEGQMSDLDKQEQDLIAQRRLRSQNEMNKPLAMGVIGGRVSEIERQENERLDSIGRQKQYLATQVQAKNATIDNLIRMKGEDFATASNRYDAEFAKNVQMMNLVQGIKRDETSIQDKEKDNARASLQTVYNSILGGGLDPKAMSDSQKLVIGRLEMQSGLPAGFMQNLYDKNPKSDIVFQSKASETDGNDYLQMVMRDKSTGAMTTQKFLLGKSADYERKQAELKIKQQNANTAAVKAAKYKGGGTGKGTGKVSVDPSKDIKSYQEMVGKGTISKEAAIASIKAKYPEAAGKDLNPLFK